MKLRGNVRHYGFIPDDELGQLQIIDRLAVMREGVVITYGRGVRFEATLAQNVYYVLFYTSIIYL